MNVSAITSMNSLFSGKESFNENLSIWNVSACTDMGDTFNCTFSFSSDLSEWSTGNVESICYVLSCILL